MPIADSASTLVQASPTSSHTGSVASPLPAPGFARRSLTAGFAAAGASSHLFADGATGRVQHHASGDGPAAADTFAAAARTASEAANPGTAAGTSEVLAESPRLTNGAPRHAPKSLTANKPRTRSRPKTAAPIDAAAAQHRQPVQQAAKPPAPQQSPQEFRHERQQQRQQAAAALGAKQPAATEDGDGFESAESDGGGYMSAAESAGASSAGSSSASAAAMSRAAALAAELAKLQRENARLRRTTASATHSRAAFAANSVAASPAGPRQGSATAESPFMSPLRAGTGTSGGGRGGSGGDDQKGSVVRTAELDARAAAFAAENAELKQFLAETEHKRQACPFRLYSPAVYLREIMHRIPRHCQQHNLLPTAF